MEILEKKLVEKEVVGDVICNMCGDSCRDYIDAAHTHCNYNYAAITSNFGYGSTLYDGEEFEAHICESCYQKIENMFVIKPEKKVNYWGY